MLDLQAVVQSLGVKGCGKEDLEDVDRASTPTGGGRTSLTRRAAQHGGEGSRPRWSAFRPHAPHAFEGASGLNGTDHLAKRGGSKDGAAPADTDGARRPRRCCRRHAPSKRAGRSD